MAKKNIDGTPAPRRRTTAAAIERSTAGNIGTTSGPALDPTHDPSHDPSHDPTHNEIAEAAYHRYLSRGGQDGGDFDDWLEAERDLKSPKAG